MTREGWLGCRAGGEGPGPSITDRSARTTGRKAQTREGGNACKFSSDCSRIFQRSRQQDCERGGGLGEEGVLEV